MVATVVLRQGSGPSCPRLYVVHGLDGDVMGGGSSYATLAGHLTSWRVVAMVYDEEAYACGSVPDLAACYKRRVLDDVSKNGGASAKNPIVVAGYSFGCVLAHQMASQLSQDGCDVLLVMFDLEVTWPPPKSDARVGGYDFLGGEVEAILLLCRAFGRHEFAHQAVLLMTEAKSKGESIDVDYLRQQAFAAINHRGMSYELFSTLAKRGGVNIEKIHTISDPWQPPEKYHGPALLVLAPDSAEFASAKEVNEQYCTQMEVVYGKGSHYNILQGEQALVSGDLLHKFCQRFSPAVSQLPNEGPERSSMKVKRGGVNIQQLQPSATDDTAPVDFVQGIRALRDGPESSCLYFLHGLDGDALGPGMSLGSLPSMMSGVCAVEYDDEAFACESIEALAKLYKGRILQDRAKKQAEDVLLAGRSMGALLACMIALELQKEQTHCSLVILDSEVVWPSKLDNSFCYDWLGGEVEATFWLSRLAGAKDFVEEQVQSAVTRGHLFDEGASRLQTAAFGQIASNLTAFGVNSLKEFRSICTLATSNCARLRQLLRPTSGSMRAPSGIFDGKVLIVAGGERGPKLRQVASSHFRNISMCTVNTEEVYVGEAATAIANEISWFLRSRSQDRRRKPGPEATPVGKSAREEEALVSLEEISTATVATYLLPGPDGGILGEMSNLAEALNCNCFLDFDEEACRSSTLPDVATLFLRRILQDQGWTSEEDLVHARQSKIVLVGHRSGAALAYEMAMQLQNMEMDVWLVIIQGEVSMAGSQKWLGSTCEAALALARQLGAKDFALQEAAAMAAARKEKLQVSKGRLQTRCGLAFDGISGVSLNGHPKNGVSPDDDANKLLMKAFWKVSDQLNGMSVEGFKGLVQDIASRMDWYMNLSSGADFAFDGPALLILGDETPEDADAMIESNALYCTNLEVADVLGDEHA